MKHNIRKTLAAVLFLASFVSVAFAQAPPVTQPGPPGAARPLTALKVQVVISRYEGDKKVSSLPYVIAVTANSPQGVLIRMGSQIPIALPGNQGPSFEYKNVGTNIDCSANSTDDGRFQVYVSIEDTSVMERRSSDSAPTLRTFLTRNSVVLKDGQSSQYTAAADKTTGEVVKVDVTLNVEK
jgi:hypothetical protein